MTNYGGGSLTKIAFPRGKRPHVGGGVRKPVHEFSRRSRREMLNYLNSINREKIKFIPLFIHLTCPDEFPDDPREVKEVFNQRWCRRLDRKFGRTGLVWKMEFKERQTGVSKGKMAPHFHALTFLDRGPSELYSWISTSWWESFGKRSEDHLRAGTRVERLRSWSGVIGYAAKYMGKLETLPDGVPGPGRFWGKRNADVIPVDERVNKLRYADALWMMRVLRKHTGHRYTSRHGIPNNYTVYESAGFTDQLLEYLARERR